jgi:hypothetical protein
MPEPNRSQFIQQYLLKDIGRDMEVKLDATPEDGGRSVRFRLTLKNVSADLLDVLMPRFHSLYLRSAEGRFFSWARSVSDKPNTTWLHLKANESRTIETTGEIKSAAEFQPYERQMANGAQALLSLQGDRCFLDKPGQFQAVFVLEQTPMNPGQKTRLKLDNPWAGRAVSQPFTITLGQSSPDGVVGQWSQPVGGLIGRLVAPRKRITPSEFFDVNLELKNVGASSVAVRIDDPLLLDVQLKDAAGRSVKSTLQRADVIVAVHWVVLSPGHATSFKISSRQGDARGTHLDVLSEIWKLQPGKYGLSAKYSSKNDFDSKRPQNAWQGNLSLLPIDLEVTAQKTLSLMD